MGDSIQQDVEQPKEVSHAEAFDAMWGEGLEPNLDTESKEDSTSDEDEDTNTTKVEVSSTDDDLDVEKDKELDVKPVIPATRDPYAWIEGLPEEQKEMANRLKHEVLSDRGRVSALTRKNNEIIQELAQARSKTAVTEETDESDAQTKLPDKLKQLQDDFPELGEQLIAIFNEQASTLKKDFSDQLTPIREELTADALASDKTLLEQEAADIFKTKETGIHWKEVVDGEDFAAWLNMQPEFVQNVARTSSVAQESIDVLRMYETDYQAAIEAQTAAETQDNTDETSTSRGDKLKAERQQRKTNTVSPGSKTAGTDTDEIAGDYEAQFNAMWGKKKTNR